MANKSSARRISPLQELEDEMVQAMVTDTGMKPEMCRFMIRPIIRHLCSEYGGGRVYIPKNREYSAGEVVAAFNLSNNVEQVCQDFGISRRTLYRLLEESVG